MVIFWVVVTLVLSLLFAAWYFRAAPPRAFLPEKAGRGRSVVEWNTEHTRKECPTCGGWGDLRLVQGRLVKIPRSRWEHTRWVTRQMTMTCPSCLGLGNVAASWHPRKDVNSGGG